MYFIRRISLKFISKVILIWFVCFILLFYMYMNGLHTYNTKSKSRRLFNIQFQTPDENKNFDVKKSGPQLLVDSVVCAILDVNPFDNSIKRYLDLHPTTVVCNEEQEFLYINDHTVFINKSRKPKDVMYCQAKPIFKGPNKSVVFGRESQIFESSIPIYDEFIKIQCFNSSGSIIVENYHMQFVNKSIETDGRDKIPDISDFPQFNVLLMMQDSVSRINSLRYMNKTRKYLLETLGAVEMLGYNKVADNTRVNMIPLLTGDFVENQECFKDREGLDNCSFIWKEFAQKGYVTHLGEDWPYYGIFHYNLPGFKNPPTDYYDYPFHKADEGDGTYNFDGCFQGKLWSDTLYKRIIDLAKKLGQKPYFSFVLQKRHTHDYRTGLADIDISTKNVLSKLYESNLLNNTFLFLFGDHGNRFGDVRQTFVGQLEERLPLMFIYVPVWFRKKYAKYLMNLNINSRRLTTHFDMHSTLLHLLDLSKDIPKDSSKHGISLLTQIPHNRSCHDASIPPHWCTCNYHLTSKVNSTIEKLIASTVVAHLNNLLKEFDTICDILKLIEIKSCYKMLSRDGKTEEYKTIFVTNPYAAMFEATIEYHKEINAYKVVGDISRLNEYKGQSDCMGDYKLRKFCACKL